MGRRNDTYNRVIAVLNRQYPDGLSGDQVDELTGKSCWGILQQLVKQQKAIKSDGLGRAKVYRLIRKEPARCSDQT